MTFNQPKPTIFINVWLPYKNFEYYYCKKDKLTVGINVSKFYKYIKDIGLQENDANRLAISVENEKMKKREVSKTSLRDINVEELQEVNPDVYPCKIKVPFSLFQSICRKSTGLTDKIEIIRPERLNASEDRKIIFCFENQTIRDERDIIICESKEYLTFLKDEKINETIQGYYSLKDLILFTKKTNNSSSVYLYLSNDDDLMIEYDIGNLGTIRLIIDGIKKN